MTPADVKLARALQARLRVVAQRSRQRAKNETEYLRGYHIGLAVGYEESAKRIARLLRTAKGRP